MFLSVDRPSENITADWKLFFFTNIIIIVTVSAKSSLILGENKAAFCREGHIKLFILAKEIIFFKKTDDCGHPLVT